MEWHKYLVGPSAAGPLKSMVIKFCEDNPMPAEFDDETSWAIREMHDLLDQICEDNPMPAEFDDENSRHWAIREMHDLLDQLTKNGW